MTPSIWQTLRPKPSLPTRAAHYGIYSGNFLRLVSIEARSFETNKFLVASFKVKLSKEESSRDRLFMGTMY